MQFTKLRSTRSLDSMRNNTKPIGTESEIPKTEAYFRKYWRKLCRHDMFRDSSPDTSALHWQSRLHGLIQTHNPDAKYFYLCLPQNASDDCLIVFKARDRRTTLLAFRVAQGADDGDVSEINSRDLTGLPQHIRTQFDHLGELYSEALSIDQEITSAAREKLPESREDFSSFHHYWKKLAYQIEDTRKRCLEFVQDPESGRNNRRRRRRIKHQESDKRIQKLATVVAGWEEKLLNILKNSIEPILGEWRSRLKTLEKVEEFERQHEADIREVIQNMSLQRAPVPESHIVDRDPFDELNDKFPGGPETDKFRELYRYLYSEGRGVIRSRRNLSDRIGNFLQEEMTLDSEWKAAKNELNEFIDLLKDRRSEFDVNMSLLERLQIHASDQYSAAEKNRYPLTEFERDSLDTFISYQNRVSELNVARQKNNDYYHEHIRKIEEILEDYDNCAAILGARLRDWQELQSIKRARERIKHSLYDNLSDEDVRRQAATYRIYATAPFDQVGKILGLYPGAKYGRKTMCARADHILHGHPDAPLDRAQEIELLLEHCLGSELRGILLTTVQYSGVYEPPEDADPEAYATQFVLPIVRKWLKEYLNAHWRPQLTVNDIGNFSAPDANKDSFIFQHLGRAFVEFSFRRPDFYQAALQQVRAAIGQPEIRDAALQRQYPDQVYGAWKNILAIDANFDAFLSFCEKRMTINKAQLNANPTKQRLLDICLDFERMFVHTHSTKELAYFPRFLTVHNFEEYKTIIVDHLQRIGRINHIHAQAVSIPLPDVSAHRIAFWEKAKKKQTQRLLRLNEIMALIGDNDPMNWLRAIDQGAADSDMWSQSVGMALRVDAEEIALPALHNLLRTAVVDWAMAAYDEKFI